MRFIDADAVHAALDYPGLVATLRDAFVEGCMMPTRHHHALGQVGGQEATLLLMPAWSPGQEIGVKVANVFPGNAHHALPAVSATYLLFDGTTGQPRAVLDGAALTVRRTAAASALAASYLARRDVDRLLVVGTGKLAPHLARAHAAVRDYRSHAPMPRYGTTGRSSSGDAAQRQRGRSQSSSVRRVTRWRWPIASRMRCAERTWSAAPP
jgi:ornithine cyclodeaminase